MLDSLLLNSDFYKCSDSSTSDKVLQHNVNRSFVNRARLRDERFLALRTNTIFGLGFSRYQDKLIFAWKSVIVDITSLACSCLALLKTQGL